MLLYNKQHKSKIVEFYFATNSIVLTQRHFKSHFHVKTAPSRNTILSITEKFIREGSVSNLNSSFSGRKRSARTSERVEEVKERISQDPRKSSRRLSQEVGCSVSTVRRILREDLGLFPYKIWTRQKLSAKDMEAREDFCRWVIRRCDLADTFLENIWFSDETHFYLDGRVNTQNNRFWGDSAPDLVSERPLHSKRCTAWCAISSTGVIGPIWLEDQDGSAATVTAKRYCKVLHRFWGLLQRCCADNINIQWLQQDGAPAHTARESLDWIQNHFGNRVISKKTIHEWPPRSPDLTPPDFFLWGYLKDRVFKNNPKDIPELKKAVASAIKTISPEVCSNVIEEVRKRAELCMMRKGAHLEHVL